MKPKITIYRRKSGFGFGMSCWFITKYIGGVGEILKAKMDYEFLVMLGLFHIEIIF